MKTITGTVVSVKMNHTVVLERQVVRSHPLYKKIMRHRRKLKAHTTRSVAVGDQVEVRAIRPRAKEVRYEVTEKGAKSL